MSAVNANGFVFTSSQLEEACTAYVENGPAVTKKLRQDEVDGAKAFLLSEAASSLRIKPAPLPPSRGGDRILDCVAIDGCKASAEVRHG